MNSISIEMSALALILAYALMWTIFLVYQKQGKMFMDSLDKAFVWISCLFVIGYSLNTAAYVTMA